MTDFKAAAIALGLVVIGVTSIPAVAQQVLVCQTLHNDLANFDRRAAAVDKVQTAINTVRVSNEATQTTTAFNCAAGNVFATNCEGHKAEAARRQAQLDQVIVTHTKSRIGGSDPVRLNIIAAMRDNGCLEFEGVTVESIENSATADEIDMSRVVRAKD